MERARITLKVRDLQRAGALVPGALSAVTVGAYAFSVETDEFGAQLHYAAGPAGGELQTIRERVPIDRTPCYYGGSRPWFRCPGCLRRVAVLYLHGDGLRFRCRTCLRLLYDSQREDDADRALRQARKIRDRLRLNLWPEGAEYGRPKGMHRSTYERLVDEAADWDSLSFALAFSVGPLARLHPALGAFRAQYRARKKQRRVSRGRPVWGE